mmetsp:Transcript_8508/g.27058  ORF Transcript_8508/g.27058 Transcript_8508/m.27058 type:complete len:325 (+) Transcript_8508:914-1888(+)
MSRAWRRGMRRARTLSTSATCDGRTATAPSSRATTSMAKSTCFASCARLHARPPGGSATATRGRVCRSGRTTGTRCSTTWGKAESQTRATRRLGGCAASPRSEACKRRSCATRQRPCERKRARLGCDHVPITVRCSATIDRGDNDEEGEGTTTRTEDEDINWDDAAEGIDEGIEGPEGFRDSDDDDEERGGEGGATRRRGEIANGPSREGDGGARGGNGDATDDANRGTDGDGDGEGDSDVEVDAAVSRAPPKSRRTAMEVTANGGRTARYEKAGRGGWRKKCREGHGGAEGREDERRARRTSGPHRPRADSACWPLQDIRQER